MFSLLDRTGTSFGARALRRLLERPLGRRAGIEARLDAVEELQEDAARLESLASAFREIPDLPRLLARLAVGAGSPRDLAVLGDGLVRAGRVGAHLGAARASILAPGGEASAEGVPFALGESIARRVVPEPPPHARDGGIFRDGVDAAVDEVRALRRESASILARVEAEERAQRGIPTLRVKFNQVFGHVFEVPGSARARIPEDALKRQTLANVERYATPELVEVDEKLRSADARLAAPRAGAVSRARGGGRGGLVAHPRGVRRGSASSTRSCPSRARRGPAAGCGRASWTSPCSSSTAAATPSSRRCARARPSSRTTRRSGGTASISWSSRARTWAASRRT